MVYSRTGMDVYKALCHGGIKSGKIMKPFTRDDVVKKFLQLNNNRNRAGQYRIGANMSIEDYLEFANRERG